MRTNTTVHFRLPKNLRDDLDKVMEFEGTSFGEIMRIAVRVYLQQINYSKYKGAAKK